MKVAEYHSSSDIRIKDIPVPRTKEGELLVKVKASGICGSDLMEWYRTKKGPRVLGHEIAGDIVESNSEKYSVGQRVFVSHHVPCGNCRYCRENNQTACEMLHRGNFDPGGFSEYIRVSKENADRGTYVLPDSMSYEEGSMIEPLACCIRGQSLLDIRPIHTVLVMGCGVSGLMNIAIAKLSGARVIATDLNSYRIKKAKEFGADIAMDAKKKIDERPERIIISTGALAAVEQAFKVIDRKGKILLFAVPKEPIVLPNTDFWRNELSLISSYGAGPKDLEASLDLIKTKKVDVKSMITHRFSLDKIQDAFRLASEAGNSLKVLIVT
ncbi:MAG: alcohol dehydrogenase catalytic domain-containing protein [Nanoarchaeota archaeon]|nr:alcohol dehydrogenase catalytic domain-containing protein [Nanoarchaeota archaeon]